MDRALVLCLAALCFIVIPGCEQKVPEDFPADTLNSVVQVGYVGLDPASGPDVRWICSGVIVGHDQAEYRTRILTAKHCSCDPETSVAYPGKAFIRIWNQDAQEWSAPIAAERRIDHETRDATVLIVKGIFGKPMSMACHPTELFSKCWNIGVSFYTGDVPNPTEGMVSSRTTTFDKDGEMVSTAQIVPGYSGGALIGYCFEHDRWEVIGINSKVVVPAYGAAYHIAISVPVYDILAWALLTEEE